VIATACTQQDVLVVSLDETGTVRLHRWRADGTERGAQVLALVGPPDARSPSMHWPKLVAVDATAVLWCKDEQLACHSLDDGKLRWQAELSTGSSFRPRVLDRLAANEAATSAAHECLLVRRHDRMTCYR
jgi:hypothetical protein